MQPILIRCDSGDDIDPETHEHCNECKDKAVCVAIKQVVGHLREAGLIALNNELSTLSEALLEFAKLVMSDDIEKFLTFIHVHKLFINAQVLHEAMHSTKH
jgi:hypothetical protein